MSIYNEEIEHKKFQSQKHKYLDKIVKKQLKTSGKFRIEKMGSGPGIPSQLPTKTSIVNCVSIIIYLLSNRRLQWTALK